MPRKLLFSAMKNEGPFILEWIAYHRVIGFDEIHICENDSTDGTDTLLTELEKSGYITYYRNNPPKGRSAQANAAKIWNDAAILKDGDWAIFLDADEFLNIHVGNRDVDALINFIGENDGMLIPWRVFGDSGNMTFPGRFISADFSRTSVRNSEINYQIKTLFRKSKFVDGFSSECNHRPKINALNEIVTPSFLNGKGRALDKKNSVTADWLSGEDSWLNCALPVEELSWGIAQINHYTVRTPEQFALKRLRGRGWKAGQKNDRHKKYFYKKNNRNERVDISVLFHKDKVDAEISAMMSHKNIVAAHNQTIEMNTDATASEQDWVDEIKKAAIAVPKFALPIAEKEIVRRSYENADCILEYGCGGSTRIALETKVKAIVSVTNEKLLAKNMDNFVQQFHTNDKSLVINCVDLGRTKKWGRPLDESGYQMYPTYANNVWDNNPNLDPDVVHIYGRFRKACFVATARNIKKPTRVLIDNYADRPDLKQIEVIAKPTQFAGRMAVFDIVPGIISKEIEDETKNWFYDPE